jgi:hypothetical protein
MKKLFSIVATVAMLSTLVPNVSFGATYSDELQEAYDYAYGIGVTTQDSIESAYMYGNLIRSHMAKMMVNFAKELGKTTVNTAADCNFTDVANESGELRDYILESCQRGIMGIGIEKFRPGDTVTRAEFGTVLSRVLWGDENNGGDPYYVNHLNALKSAGIMNNISNPSMKEVRGYVMLMMMRADEGTQPAICSTPENVLACSLNLSTCPAECKTVEEEETEVKAGTMTVSLGDSLANGSQIPNAGIVRFATVNFKAASSDVSLKTVKLMKVGLANIPSGTRVWFENNGVRVTGRASFTTDGEAYLSFAPAYVVKAGSTEMLDLYVELNTDAGIDVQFKSEEVTSTAQSTNGGFTTPSLRTANYTVNKVKFDADATASTAKVTDNGVELGAFTLTHTGVTTAAPQRDVTVKSITLRQNEAASLDNLSNIVLERNGVVVSNGYTIDGKYLTIKVNDIISKDTSSVKYTVKGVVNNVETSSDKYEFKLNATSDFNAIETLNGFRVSVDETSSDYLMGEVSVNGGDLTFARDTTMELNKEYPAGSQVTLMKGSITSKEAVTLEDITMGIGATTTASLDTFFTTLYLKVGSSVFSYSPTSANTASTNIKFEGTANINGKVNVELYGTLKNTASGTVKFDELKLNSLGNPEYVSNGITVGTAVGSIAGISVNIQSTPLNVTRVDGLGDTTVAAGTDNVTLYKIKLSSNQGNGVRVSNAKFAVAASGDFADNTTLTLLVNGVAKESKTFTTSPISFTNFGSVTINPTTDANVEIVANINENVDNTSTIQITLDELTATDLLTSSAITTYSEPVGALFTVNTANAAISISKDLVLSKLLLSPSTNEKLAAIKLSPTNDRVRLYNVALGISGANHAANYRLVNMSGTTIATATSIVGETVTFSNMANTPFVEKDLSASYYLIADINSNISTAADLVVNLVSADGRASNGTTVGSATAGAANAHKIFDKSVVITKELNPNKSITTSALRFKVNAIGKDVELNNIDLALSTAGYTAGSTDLADIKVYKNSVAMANEVTRPTTVDAGTEVTFIVTVPTALVDGGSSSQDWNIALNGIEVNGLDVSPFYNVGEFPMTERK